MKKSILLCIILSAMFVGCKKNDDNPDNGSKNVPGKNLSYDGENHLIQNPTFRFPSTTSGSQMWYHTLVFYGEQTGTTPIIIRLFCKDDRNVPPGTYTMDSNAGFSNTTPAVSSGQINVKYKGQFIQDNLADGTKVVVTELNRDTKRVKISITNGTTKNGKTVNLDFDGTMTGEF